MVRARRRQQSEGGPEGRLGRGSRWPLLGGSLPAQPDQPSDESRWLKGVTTYKQVRGAWLLPGRVLVDTGWRASRSATGGSLTSGNLSS